MLGLISRRPLTGFDTTLVRMLPQPEISDTARALRRRKSQLRGVVLATCTCPVESTSNIPVQLLVRP